MSNYEKFYMILCFFWCLRCVSAFISANEFKHEALWVASIQRKKNGVFKHVCGGSILSEYKIVTACQCLVTVKNNAIFQRISPDSFLVMAGNLDLLSDDILRRDVKATKVSEKCTPPKNSAAWEHDIGLLILSESFFWMSTIEGQGKMARDPKYAMHYVEQYTKLQSYCQLCGWGAYAKVDEKKDSNSPENKRDGTYKYNSQISCVNLKLIKPETCLEYSCNTSLHCGKPLPEMNQMCTTPQVNFNTKQLEGDTCEGDVGTGLKCQLFLIGILSWGHFACQTANKTYVTVFQEIDKMTLENVAASNFTDSLPLLEEIHPSTKNTTPPKRKSKPTTTATTDLTWISVQPTIFPTNGARATSFLLLYILTLICIATN